jgi:nucleoside-diphosphate-sugar epimerase
MIGFDHCSRFPAATWENRRSTPRGLAAGEGVRSHGLKEMLPMQPGDVPATYADIEDLVRDVGFKPATTIEDGIGRFAKWYRAYHKI